MQRSFRTLSWLLVAWTLASCDNGRSLRGPDPFGEFDLAVTGAFQQDLTGTAGFVFGTPFAFPNEPDQSNRLTIGLSAHSQQSLDFLGGHTRPAPGRLQIGTGAGELVVLFRSRTNSLANLRTFHAVSGHVDITESSVTVLRGTFNIVAAEDIGSAQVTVTGTFRATCLACVDP